MADSYTHRKFLWLDQIVRDRKLPPHAFRLAYAITSFMYRKGGGREAWPSLQTLVALLGLTDRALRTLADKLVEAGHLNLTKGRGRGNSNHYRPIIHKSPEAEEVSEPEPTVNGATLFPDMEPQPGSNNKAAVEDGILAEFEAWWFQYPKKVAKRGALRAYRVARKSGASADELMAGVLRYAAARAGQDPKYTMHPATWLNNGRWADEEAPAAPNGPAQYRHLKSALGGLK